MKRICVTGAGQGLGKAITARLIEDGYRVVAVDVRAERLTELATEFGDRIEPVVLDVSDYSAVERALSDGDSESLVGLVNNAGIYLGKGILDYSSEEISKVFDINLKGAAYCSKFFGESLLKRGVSGSIVNISSSSIHGGSDPIYSASKAGLIGLTKSCALKFSPYVRVNAVAPGIVVDTELAGNIPPEVLDLYRARELIKTPLTPRDVANTVGFLMSDSSRSYTGAVFELNNGCHM
jgi:3-oxoacyl-[acyl-carrier protein] reductase